jgi:hypothetical protein
MKRINLQKFVSEFYHSLPPYCTARADQRERQQIVRITVLICELCIELPVKTQESCELEEWEIGLSGQLGAPMPGRGQTAVYAGSWIEESVIKGEEKRKE